MAWKPIIVGVDGSPESVRAVQTAMLLSERAGAECHLVHAVPDFYASTTVAEFGVSLSHLEEGALVHGRALVTAALQDHVPPEQLARLEIWRGRAAIVLDDVAQRSGAELIILGGKHHRGLDRLAGSTVSHVVRSGGLPVLATAGGDPAALRRVLVAVDLSYAAKPTIEAAERWAALFGAQLRVLNVVEPLPLIPGVPQLMIDDDEYYRSTERLLETTVWPLITYPDAERVIRRGRAASAVAEEAARWKADLLVVGSHGRGWVDRLLVGSTSERLINILPVATLVVPVRKPEAVGTEVRSDLQTWPAFAVAGALHRA